MIFVDTTPLVALCDPLDEFHPRAMRDLDRVGRRDLVVCSPVITEACFLLQRPAQRQRLDRILADLPTRPFAPADEASLWLDAFAWLRRYADHQRDWADAYMAAASTREKRARVWTYDGEFRTTWRRLDGTRIPLAAR